MSTKVGKIRRAQRPRVLQTALARSLGGSWSQSKVSLVETGQISITAEQERLILEMIERLHHYDLEIRDQLSKLKLPAPPLVRAGKPRR